MFIKTAGDLGRSFRGLLLFGFGLFLNLGSALPQEFRINHASLDSLGRIVIDYEAQASVPYVLLRGDSVTNISASIATNSGPAGPAKFIQVVAPTAKEIYFSIRQQALLTTVALDPVSGSSAVGVTVRPKATFPHPVVPSSLNGSNFFASFAGSRLPATIVPANDGTFAWLFLDQPMPSASQITVTIDGSSIPTQDGSLLDADANGTPGGAVMFSFSTVSVTSLPGTALAGRVVDPGADLKPRTLDDIGFGTDGSIRFLRPIAGVKVYLLGMEDQPVFTDSQGWFQFDSAPVGDVKVVLDGRTATRAHDGYYWPEMVLDTHDEPGITNFVSMIGRATNALPEFLQTMYLPRVPSNIFQSITSSATNTIRLQSEAAAYDLPSFQAQYLTAEIQPNSLIGMDGQPMASGQVGISVVPPELVADMLPPGLLQHTFDITIQAPGVATFATPAPMTFPNVFNALPGTKLNFLSFDHTTGRLMIEGTATVSSDGLTVRTDPGTGITHPGWHGLTPPGVNGDGGGGGNGNPNGCPDCSKPKNCDSERKSAISAVAQCAVGVAAAIPKSAPLIGCAIGFGLGGIGAAVDCKLDSSGCGKSIALNTVGSLIGCVPVIGGALGATWGCGIQAGTALIDYNGCLNVINARQAAASSEIPKNIFFEQQSLWAAAADVYALVLGDSKWTVIDPADYTRAQAIFLALQSSLDPASPGGEGIIQSERDAILQLPLPANISTADVGAVLTRFDQLMNGQAPTGGLDLKALGSASSNLVQVATTLQSRGWATTFDAYLRGMSELSSAQDEALKTESLGGPVSLAPDVFYKLTNLSDGFVQRGRLPKTGSFDQLFMAADTSYTLEYVDPSTAQVALTAFRTGPSGSSLKIPRAIFVNSSSPDTDGDGLSDEAEEIIGTDPLKSSTCGDGVSDLAKVQQGLDLSNCLPPPTGIIATLPLPGEAKMVVLDGSLTNAQQQIAYVACGSRGLSIVDATKSQTPILLGQLDLPGDSTDVSVEANLRIAAVAANAGGLHLVDVSDPMKPRLLRTIAVTASQVDVWDGIVYVAVGSALNSYDLLTGELQQTLPFGGGLAREGSMLYAVDSAPVLHIVDISGPTMLPRGSASVPNGASKLFVGGGIAYIALGSSQGGIKRGGIATVNISDPDHPALLSGVSPLNIEGDAIAANGSGLAIAVGYYNSLSGQPVFGLDVLNVSDPANTGNLLSRILFPTAPAGVAIGSGIAFVADGTNGLAVVNYLPIDNKKIAPIVSITTSAGTAAEGSLMPVGIKLSDDVQVRIVELLVDGRVVQKAVSFPFDLSAALPLLSSGASNVIIQVRATDTGGNVGLSGPITIQLLRDTTPPSLAQIDPPDDSVRSPGFRTITLDFSEPIDPASVTSHTMQLSGSVGVISPENIQLRLRGTRLQLTYPALGAGDYQIVINSPPVKDRVGNVMASTNIVRHFTIGSGATAMWIGSEGGFWDEPSNWSGGILPGPSDDVVIGSGGSTPVIFRQGTNTVHSLLSAKAFTITGGTLNVATTMAVDNLLTLNRGKIIGATISSGTSGQIVVTNVPGVGKMVLDGVTLAGDVQLGDSTFTTSLTITNGLTLSGARVILKTLQYAASEIIFTGTQTLGGTGEVVFAGKGSVFRTYGNTTPEGANVLTIGSGISIHGVLTKVVNDDSSTIGGRDFDTIVNEGTIVAGVTNQAILIFWDGSNGKIINRGTIRAENQGLLTVRGMVNQGAVSANAGAQVNLEGAGFGSGWTNIATIAVTNSTLTVRGNWSNSGTISAVNSTVNIDGAFTTDGLGTFNRTGGSVYFYGVLDNSGRTFALDPTWKFFGGTIKGGTLTSSSGGGLTVDNRGSGTLDSVNLKAALTVAGASYLTIKNGLTLNGLPLTVAEYGASLVFVGTQTLSGAGDIVFTGTDSPKSFYVSGGGSQAQAAIVTIGPNINIHGSAAGFLGAPFDTLINQGSITADTIDQKITVGSADGNLITVINEGTIQALNGGQLALAGNDRNAGQLTPGNPPQLMSVRGTFTQLPAGSLNIHILGTTPGTGFSQVNVTGAVALDGTLNLTRINGYEPLIGDTFAIITSPSATGQFSVVNGLDIGNGKRFELNYSATGLSLTVVASP